MRDSGIYMVIIGKKRKVIENIQGKYRLKLNNDDIWKHGKTEIEKAE